MLLDAGNPLSAVSHWIGHASTEITSQYWERSPGQLTQNLRMPWAPQPAPTAPMEPSSDEEEVLGAVSALLDRNRALRRRLQEVTTGTCCAQNCECG